MSREKMTITVYGIAVCKKSTILSAILVWYKL